MDMNIKKQCFSVNLHLFSDDQANGEISLCEQNQHQDLTLQVGCGEGDKEFTIRNGDGVCVFKFSVGRETDCCRAGNQSFLVSLGCISIILYFRAKTEFRAFQKLLKKECRVQKEPSAFDQRTDDSSARQYFQFYGCLSQQQNMLQDYIRTATYQKAILLNEVDFKDKVVLDVGCGSGILSFFAIQAGARKVYAVEASSVVRFAETLVKSNQLSDRITVLPGKVEEVLFPESVDIIVSEPIGYMLLNERMLESYLHSKKWLKPRGSMKDYLLIMTFPFLLF